MSDDSRHCTRVLFLCLSGVGDALLASPLISAVSAARPDWKLEVLVMFGAAGALYRNHPAVSAVHHVPMLTQSIWASLRQIGALRKRGYLFSVAAYPSNRREYNLLLLLLGGVRVGHRYHLRDSEQWNGLKQKTVMEDESRHVVENNLALMPLLGLEGPPEPPEFRLWLGPEAIRAALAWEQQRGGAGAGRPMAGIHAGAALFKNHIHKRWAPEHFAEVARRCVRELGARVLIFGGPEERALQEQIRRLSGCDSEVEPVTSPDMQVSAAMISRCRLFISNDSGLMHVAAAAKVPTVAVFAYTNPASVRPWGVSSRVVRRDLPCSPCFHFSPTPASCRAGLNFACIRELGVDAVWKAVTELWGDPSRRGSP